MARSVDDILNLSPLTTTSDYGSGWNEITWNHLEVTNSLSGGTSVDPNTEVSAWYAGYEGTGHDGSEEGEVQAGAPADDIYRNTIINYIYDNPQLWEMSYDDIMSLLLEEGWSEDAAEDIAGLIEALRGYDVASDSDREGDNLQGDAAEDHGGDLTEEQAEKETDDEQKTPTSRNMARITGPTRPPAASRPRVSLSIPMSHTYMDNRSAT